MFLVCFWYYLSPLPHDPSTHSTPPPRPPETQQQIQRWNIQKNDPQFLSSKKLWIVFLDISTVEFVAMSRCFFPPPAPPSYERVITYAKSPIFEDLVLIANLQYSDNLVKIPTCSSSRLAFCVELWPKQVWYRISVPMSYISLVYFVGIFR